MAKEEKKKNSKAQEETVEATETETKAEEATEEKEPTAEEKLTEELKKEKEKYMRLAAEYDNYRKRTQQEKLGMQQQRQLNSYYQWQMLYKWLCKMQKMHHRNF